MSTATDVQLTFYKWLKLQTVDYFWVLASTNGTEWWGYYWAGGSVTWTQSFFDLRDWPHWGNLCGQAQVRIAFVFQSDASLTDKGAFLDLVQLKQYSDPVPVITAISPSQASAGTGSEINVVGNFFGNTPGSVQFFYKGGKPWISGGIISWTNESIRATVPVGVIDNYSASASSGPISIINVDNVYSYPYHPFTVTFSYGSRKWPGDSPVISFYVNPNSPDCSGEEQAVQRAAATWSEVSDKAFSFDYVGSSNAIGAGENGINEIMWTDLTSTGPLAHAILWWDENNVLYETDIEFNEYFNWSTAAIPGAEQFDVETIALHEMGHWLFLRDLYGNVSGFPQDINDIMYGFGPKGATKRSLHADDIAGIRWIYPGESPYALIEDATGLTSHSARLNAHVYDLGSLTSARLLFQWGTESGNYIHETPVQTIDTSNTYSADISDLDEFTDYFYRAKIFGNGIQYTEEKHFKTLKPLDSISIQPENPRILKGYFQAFSATGNFTDGTSGDITALVAWSSSNESVATIQNGGVWTGQANAVDLGQTTITASLLGKQASTTMTVIPWPLRTIDVSPDYAVIFTGGTQQFTAMGEDVWGESRNATLTATWTSSDPDIATIGEHTGLAQGIAPGLVTITAAEDEKSSTAVLIVIPAGTTLIGEIKQNPAAYEGQKVTLYGAYKGWTSGYGAPPVTRSDWVLEDASGQIYVTGSSLNLRYPADVDRMVIVTGIVRVINGVPHIEIPRQSLNPRR